MSKIEKGHYSEFLRRYLGQAGVSFVADELAPEISATIQLEAERPEWQFLMGQRLMSYRINVSPLAGNNSGVMIRNPPTSGIVAILTNVQVGVIEVNWTVIATAGANLIDYATVSGTVPRDGRFLAINGACIVSMGNGVGGGNALDGISGLAQTSERILEYQLNPYVLLPGFAYRLVTAQSNVSLVGNIAWLEKRLDQLEQGTG